MKTLSEREQQIGFMFLWCLNVVKKGKIYQGTVSRQQKVKRRKLNQRQKASRRQNRGK